jgi:hypothetical protein
LYLYLGQDTVINTSEIVGIFDIENTSLSKETKKYLATAQKNGHVREVSYELPKSYVVCEIDGAHTVYLSQISPGTLEKRTHYFRDLL